MRTNVCSDEDGAEDDNSGLDEDVDSVSVDERETDCISSIDDIQSKPGNVKCFEVAGSIVEKDLHGFQKQMERHGEPRDEESAGDVKVSAISFDSLAADVYSETKI